MKKVFGGLLVLTALVAISAVSQADVIRNVTATASSEYFPLIDANRAGESAIQTVTWRGIAIKALAGQAGGWLHTVTINDVPTDFYREGEGFYAWKGYHNNETYDMAYSNAGEMRGTMWLSDLGTTPASQWIEFDLTADPNAIDLAAVKVWNFNQASPTYQWDKLDCGVQTMDIVLLDSSDNVISTATPTTNIGLAMAPGLADVDFGQVIDIANDYNGGTPVTGVRYVRFENFTNYGDVFNQVGLSQVQLYNSRNTVEAFAGLTKRAWLEDTGGLGDPDDYQAVLVFDDAGHKGGVGPFNYTWNWYSPMHAAALTDPNSPGPLPAPVFDPVNSLNPTVTFPNESRVTVPGWSSYPVAGPYVFSLTIEDVGAGVTVTSPNKSVMIQRPDYTGLFAHWKFDEGSGPSSADELGNNNITWGLGDEDGPAWVTPGVDGTGSALSFLGQVDGANAQPNNNYDAITLNGIPFSDFEQVALTMWFLMRPETGADASNIQHSEMGLVDKGAWKAHIKGDRVYASFNVTRSFAAPFDLYDMVGKTNINDGKWHFLVLTYDGYSAKMYMDGRLDAERITYPGWVTGGLTTPLMLGARNWSGSEAWVFDGLMDDVRVYEIYLDQGQVAALYEEVMGQAPCTEPLDGDLDGNCVVNLEDFAILAQDWLL